jgi:hypothetical protein
MKGRQVEIKICPLRTNAGPDEDDLQLTPAERIALVWPLTVDAWAFKGEPVAESRLRDMLSVFLEESVEFLIVGAYAIAAHGLPRATKDLDIWVRCSEENANRIIRAIERFGAPVSGITPQDFLRPGITFQIGVAPRRIDIMTEIAPVTFDTAYANRVTVDLEGIAVPVIGRADLLTNKRATGRPQDLLDAKWLETQP